MEKIIKIFLVISILILGGCSSNEVAKNEINTKYSKQHFTELAKTKYGKTYRSLESPDKKSILCFSSNEDIYKKGSVIDYFVFNKNENSIVYENQVLNGQISWYSNYELKITTIPGMIKKNDTSKNEYILNIITNSKTKLNGGVN